MSCSPLCHQSLCEYSYLWRNVSACHTLCILYAMCLGHSSEEFWQRPFPLRNWNQECYQSQQNSSSPEQSISLNFLDMLSDGPERRLSTEELMLSNCSRKREFQTLYFLAPCVVTPCMVTAAMNTRKREFRKTSTSALLTMPKPLTVWITTNCGKSFKRWEIPDHLACLLRNLCACQEASVRIGYGTMDWFLIVKRVQQGCVLSPCLFKLFAE